LHYRMERDFFVRHVSGDVPCDLWLQTLTLKFHYDTNDHT
jgi:hypothetical protein